MWLRSGSVARVQARHCIEGYALVAVEKAGAQARDGL